MFTLSSGRLQQATYSGKQKKSTKTSGFYKKMQVLTDLLNTFWTPFFNIFLDALLNNLVNVLLDSLFEAPLDALLDSL